MRLYLIRHAHAHPIAPGGDPHRTLTSSGLARAAALAEAFVAGAAPLDARPVRVISSPAIRADQTARPIAEALGVELEFDPRVSLAASAAQTLLLIGELIGARVPAALVGHNPDFSDLAQRFGGGHLAPGELVVCEMTLGESGPQGRVISRA